MPRRLLADFSKRYPESVYNNDLRFAQGLLYCSRSEYDKALACFGRVNYRALDRTRREQYDLRMGYIEFGRDDYDRAMTYFDRINPQSEFYDHALYYKSYIAYAREQYDWARSGFERLLKKRKACARGSALLPAANRVQAGELPLRGRERRRVDPPGIAPPAGRTLAGHGRSVVSLGRIFQTAGLPRRFRAGRRRNGPG